MVTINQVKSGVLKYIDSELMPHISRWKQVAVAAYIALAADNVASMILSYKSNPAIAVLNLFDDKNNIDIDKAYKAITSGMDSTSKIEVDFPVIGRFVFDITDIDKLYNYIKEA